MSMGTRWRRIDAERWVWVLLVIETVLASVAALVAIVWGLALGISPILLLLVLIFPALNGWFTSAWRRDRPWAWWVVTTLSGIGLVLSVGELLTAGPSWSAVIGMLVDGVFLLLLSHPHCVARIQPAAAEREPIA